MVVDSLAQAPNAFVAQDSERCRISHSILMGVCLLLWELVLIEVERHQPLGILELQVLFRIPFDTFLVQRKALMSGFWEWNALHQVRAELLFSFGLRRFFLVRFGDSLVSAVFGLRTDLLGRSIFLCGSVLCLSHLY